MLRRIGPASSVMDSLRRVWNNRRLTIGTKVYLYRTLVLSVLLYGAETWTLLANDLKTLEAFHMRCQRQTLKIRWQDHVTNDAVRHMTGMAPLQDYLQHRRLSSATTHG